MSFLGFRCSSFRFWSFFIVRIEWHTRVWIETTRNLNESDQFHWIYWTPHCTSSLSADKLNTYAQRSVQVLSDFISVLVSISQTSQNGSERVERGDTNDSLSPTFWTYDKIERTLMLKEEWFDIVRGQDKILMVKIKMTRLKHLNAE